MQNSKQHCLSYHYKFKFYGPQLDFFLLLCISFSTFISPPEYFLQSLNSGLIALYDFKLYKKINGVRHKLLQISKCQKIRYFFAFLQYQRNEILPVLMSDELFICSLVPFHLSLPFIIFLSLIFHISGSTLFPSWSGFLKYSTFIVSFCYLNFILNSKFCTYYAIKNTL